MASKYELPEEVDEKLLESLGREVEMKTFRTNTSEIRGEALVKIICVGNYTGSLRTQTYFRLSRFSPPKNNVCISERQNDFRDVRLLFSLLPIRLHDRMKLEWSTRRTKARELANTMAYPKLILTAQNLRMISKKTSIRFI